jgi:hypothetical protein
MERFYGRIPSNHNYTILSSVVRYVPEFFKHYEYTNITRKHSCELCNFIGSTHIHHIVPLSEGGTHRKINFIELCPKCHKRIEEGIYKITNTGKYNYRLLRKCKKLMLKFYKEEFDRYEKGYNTPSNKFIYKHLELNHSILFFIKNNKVDRAKELIKLIN